MLSFEGSSREGMMTLEMKQKEDQAIFFGRFNSCY
jgi:hypothetical protein